MKVHLRILQQAGKHRDRGGKNTSQSGISIPMMAFGRNRTVVTMVLGRVISDVVENLGMNLIGNTGMNLMENPGMNLIANPAMNLLENPGMTTVVNAHHATKIFCPNSYEGSQVNAFLVKCHQS